MSFELESFARVFRPFESAIRECVADDYEARMNSLVAFLGAGQGSLRRWQDHAQC